MVGYGYWGPRLARAIERSDACHLVAICERDATARSTAADSHAGVRCTTELLELLHSDEIDAVALATPAETHFPLALAALEAGKHVFVEKPLALELDHVDRLTHRAIDLDRTLMVDHIYVFTGAVDRIVDLVETNAIAPDGYRSHRINMGRVQGAVDVLFDLVVHDIAILDRLRRAQPVDVRSEIGSEGDFGPGEFIRVVLDYDDGFEADITAGWSAPAKQRRIELTGADHLLVYDDDEPIDKLRLRSGTDDRVVPCDLTEPLSRSLADFAGCVNGDVVPMADGAAARRVVTVLEAIAHSLTPVRA